MRIIVYKTPTEYYVLDGSQDDINKIKDQCKQNQFRWYITIDGSKL